MTFPEPFLFFESSLFHLLQSLLTERLHVILIQFLKLVHLIVKLIFNFLGRCQQVLFNNLLLQLLHCEPPNSPVRDPGYKSPVRVDSLTSQLYADAGHTPGPA